VSIIRIETICGPPQLPSFHNSLPVIRTANAKNRRFHVPQPTFLFPLETPLRLSRNVLHGWKGNSVAQLREAMEAVASGRPWKGGAACRQQCFFLFCLITKFCHVLWLPMTLHSIHFAQYAHALPLTIIS